MNTRNNPLITATSLTRARTLFRVANLAERSLLSQIFHELAEFRLMAEIINYEGKDYQVALNDYLTALKHRYHALVRFSGELNHADKEEETSDAREIASETITG